MNRALGMFGLLAMLCVTLTFAVPARAQEMKTMTWTGWISDSACGAKGAKAEHKECAMKCVNDKGASYVFVNTQTKKILKIHNQDAVTEANLGQEVKVTGHMAEDGEIHIDSIANAAM